MSNPTRTARRTLWGLILLAVSITGCTEEIWITQIPSFYTPDLKTVAVMPFRNQSNDIHAGDVMADKFASRLMANGSYRVYNRNDLKAVLNESDLRMALGADPSAAADKLKGVGNCQAMLIGTVSTYVGTSNSQRRQDPIYQYDKRGNQYIAGYNRYTLTRNEGNVSVTAVLLRTSDGSTIASTSRPISARVSDEGSPPNRDMYACREQAADSVAAQMVMAFAPVRRKIKVDPKKALRTATDRYDNKWNCKDKFDQSATEMTVVVSLPASCDRNPFRLVIIRKDQREDLASHDFVWSRSKGSVGFTFDPSEIARKGGGPGEYEVKFYSGPEPVMRHKFKIR